jgi:hypothetical protein
MTQESIWSRFHLDPRTHTRLRAADEDRDIIRECLGDAFADGRLDREEFDERLTAVSSARLLGDLLDPVADLVLDAHPIESEAPGDRESGSATAPVVASTGDAVAHRPHRSPHLDPPPLTPAEIERAAHEHHSKLVRSSLSSFVGASAITTLIWLGVGLFSGGFSMFWPVFVMVGTGIGVVSTMSRRSQMIEQRRRELTRRAREYRELEGGSGD